MSDFLTEWFQGFEKGISELGQPEKERFFRECGRKCADTGIINVYKNLYQASGDNIDTFFDRLSEIENVGGKVVIPGKIYEIAFPRCLCDLHTMGYINSGCICECSRQSIIYVINSLKPELELEVEKIATILSGDKECRFRISII